VARTYALELKCVVEWLGEESRVKVKWGRVVVFAARMDAGVESAIKEIERGTGELGVEAGVGWYEADSGSGSGVQVEEELPSYRHATKGNI
jgi:hypothetical protein